MDIGHFKEKVEVSDYYYNSPFEFMCDGSGDLTALNPEYEFFSPICTMEDYYYDRLAKYYEAFVSKCVRDGRVSVNRSTVRVPFPDRAETYDMSLKRLECSRVEGSRTAFNIDAVIETHLYIYQKEESVSRALAYHDAIRNCRMDKVKQWYRVRGTFDLGKSPCGLCREIMIYDRKDAIRKDPLSTALIPIISRSQLDAETEKMLKKYHMEESISKCGRVDGFVLAEHMGLKVRRARLSRDYHTRGKLYPFAKDITVFNDDGTEELVHVEEGTILIDPVACKNTDGIQDAIIHECVHYELHNLFYCLQRTYNEELEFLACIDNRYQSYLTEDVYDQRIEDEAMYVVARKLDNGRFEPKSGHEWAEWQAVNMTPHIRMPAVQTKKKINALYDAHRDMRRSGANSAEVAAAVIKDLARFYGTNTNTARLRMIDLGYHVARGAMVQVDGEIVPPFMTSNGRMAAANSYVVSTENLKKLFLEDDELRKEMETRPYIYVEHHICLDHPTYVERTSDGFRLTDYARSHIDVCCLSFKIVKMAQQAGYDKNAFHNDAIKTDAVAMALSSIPMDALMQFATVIGKGCDDLPRRFSDTLRYHRKRSGMSQEDLAWEVGMDVKSISRLENGEIDRPSQQVIADLGRAMKLPGMFTEDMMNKAGCPLNRDLPEDMQLKTVIYFMYMRPREECSTFLELNDCLPLGGRNRKAASTV